MSENDASQPEKKLFEAIKAYESGSSKLTTWSLSIIGGSLVIITGSSYFRPLSLECRYFYFLFIVGWIFMGISLYFAFLITRRSMVKDIYTSNADFLASILQGCNTAFKWQLRFFQWSLLSFGIWLILYLVWWICTSLPIPKP